jgi:protoporphyrinogen oxidase
MGLFYNGAMSPLSDPMALLRFDGLGPADKARFAIASAGFKWASPNRWKALENESVDEWLVKRYGRRTYEVLYEPLLRLKFREYAAGVSAAWMWARLWRLARSRTLMQRERIGYLEGGSAVFVDHLERDLLGRGVEIRTGCAVDGVDFDGGRAHALCCGGDTISCNDVISTIPAPALHALSDGLGGAYWDRLGRLQNIGVVVILLRLERRFSPHFWLNISDPRIDLAGVIEYTNLNPCPYLAGDALLYIPQYVNSSHPLFTAADDELVARHARFLGLINPDFDASSIKEWWVHRDRFSQPICRLGFTKDAPSMRTPIDNLFVTESHQLHPHDRSISGSSDLGEGVADLVLDELLSRAR